MQRHSPRRHRDIRNRFRDGRIDSSPTPMEPVVSSDPFNFDAAAEISVPVKQRGFEQVLDFAFYRDELVSSPAARKPAVSSNPKALQPLSNEDLIALASKKRPPQMSAVPELAHDENAAGPPSSPEKWLKDQLANSSLDSFDLPQQSDECRPSSR